MVNRIQTLLFYLALLGLWQLLFKLQIWPDYLFPSPGAVLESFLQGVQDQTIPIAIAASMARVAKGYLIAMAIGIPLGVLIARVKVLKNTIGSLIAGLQPLPSICWLPLAVLWIGLNERAIIFIILLGATFSITSATEAGVRNVPSLLVRAGQNLGAHGWQLYTKVLVPGAFPTIITGMKLSWAFAWRALMAGELLSSGVGLGQVLVTGRDLNDMPMVIVVMFIIAILGQIIERMFFSKLELVVKTRWGLERA